MCVGCPTYMVALCIGLIRNVFFLCFLGLPLDWKQTKFHAECIDFMQISCKVHWALSYYLILPALHWQGLNTSIKAGVRCKAKLVSDVGTDGKKGSSVRAANHGSVDHLLGLDLQAIVMGWAESCDETWAVDRAVGSSVSSSFTAPDKWGVFFFLNSLVEKQDVARSPKAWAKAPGDDGGLQEASWAAERILREDSECIIYWRNSSSEWYVSPPSCWPQTLGKVSLIGASGLAVLCSWSVGCCPRVNGIRMLDISASGCFQNLTVTNIGSIFSLRGNADM